MTGVAEAERQKYERIYTAPNYGTVGHAVKRAQLLIQRAAVGDPVIEFGCGRGGNFRPLIDAGLRVVPVDHVNALSSEWQKHPQVDTLWERNLWQGPLPTAKWGVCADVMEHIPPEFVDRVLDNIAASVSGGVLWTISHVPDVWGRRIGQPLHLTVRPPAWWTDKLKARWAIVAPVDGNDRNSVIWTEHNGNVA